MNSINDVFPNLGAGPGGNSTDLFLGGDWLQEFVGRSIVRERAHHAALDCPRLILAGMGDEAKDLMAALQLADSRQREALGVAYAAHLYSKAPRDTCRLITAVAERIRFDLECHGHPESFSSKPSKSQEYAALSKSLKDAEAEEHAVLNIFLKQGRHHKS
jgi:hypothetical protein